jgi:hypothetical protein
MVDRMEQYLCCYTTPTTGGPMHGHSTVWADTPRDAKRQFDSIDRHTECTLTVIYANHDFAYSGAPTGDVVWHQTSGFEE